MTTGHTIIVGVTLGFAVGVLAAALVAERTFVLILAIAIVLEVAVLYAMEYRR